jgi:hypothetical protein
MALMTGRGFQELGEAAGKWRRALLTSTQLSTYFVGYTEVAGIAAARPFGATPKAWHDAMLAATGSPRLPAPAAHAAWVCDRHRGIAGRRTRRVRNGRCPASSVRRWIDRGRVRAVGSERVALGRGRRTRSIANRRSSFPPSCPC